MRNRCEIRSTPPADRSAGMPLFRRKGQARMPTAINKQRILAQLFTGLRRRYSAAELEPRSVVDQFVYAICRESETQARADRAFQNLRERFFDWNEVRVSSPHEVEEVLEELSHAGSRAERIIRFLQEVFETTFSFDLDNLDKKGLKQAAKQLSRYEAATDYVVAWVLQHSLGGHALPLDAPSLRVLRRLGLFDDGDEDIESARASLEHLIPKARGPVFVQIVSALADELCLDDEPACSSCPLASECPTGQDQVSSVAPAAPRSRTKPR